MPNAAHEAMVSLPSPTQVPALPEWLAHRYEPGQDAVHFVRVDRARRRSVPFLIDKHLDVTAPVVLRRQDALASALLPAPVHFIFHSAFCCSTLVANALDREGIATSLKEPQILNDIVGWRRRGAVGRDVAMAMDAALALLARPLAAGEAVVVKPSNVVNALVPMMLAMRPEARALLLYAPLRVFLTSIARKGLDGRLWVRELFMGLRTDALVQRLGFDDAALFGQTDLQIAASGWLAQQALFKDLIVAPATAQRIRAIDSERLLANPGATLAALATHFGVQPSRGDIEEIVGEIFSRNAKTGAAFGKAERESEYRDTLSVHAEEIDKVARWAEAVAESAGIPMTLDAPLV